MNGSTLTLSLVGALAVGAALGRRGSRSHAAEMKWPEPVILLQEEVQPGFWVRVQRMDYTVERDIAAFLLRTPDADTSTQDEDDESVFGAVIAHNDGATYNHTHKGRPGTSDLVSACAGALHALKGKGVRGLYVVEKTDLDDRLHGRGLGMAMYDALIRAAWQDRYAVSPHWCAPDGHVSSEAMRVWSKLARRYPHVGDPDYMRAEEDDRNPKALAQAGTPMIVWGGGGSTNRAPTDAALRTLRAAMVKAAQADTAYDPAKWKRAKDPLTGHCYGAAHLVQDRFGGELVKGVVRGQAHAWNRLPGGREVDLTGSQYGGDGMHPLVQAEGVAASRSTNPRFARFAERVDAYLAWG